MADFITGSICLSNIPKEQIKKGKDGKMYISIVIAERQEVSTYGETHTIFMSQTEEDRNAKAPKRYIGGAKKHQPKPAPVTAEEINNLPPISQDDVDDLPFDL